MVSLVSVVLVVSVVSFRWFRFVVSGFSTCPHKQLSMHTDTSARDYKKRVMRHEFKGVN